MSKKDVFEDVPPELKKMATKLCPVCNKKSLVASVMRTINGDDEYGYDCIIGDHKFTIQELKSLKKGDKSE